MSYTNAINKMKKLENAGYLKRTCSWDQDDNIYSRHFGTLDKKSLEYLKQKIQETLEKEKVLFSLGNELVIIPHKRLINIIEISLSYPEMVKQLSELPFIYAEYQSHYNRVEIQIRAYYDNGFGNIVSHDYTRKMSKPLFKYCLSNNITTEIEEGEFTSYGDTYRCYIKSKKCEDFNNVKQAIDDLFD